MTCLFVQQVCVSVVIYGQILLWCALRRRELLIKACNITLRYDLFLPPVTQLKPKTKYLQKSLF